MIGESKTNTFGRKHPSDLKISGTFVNDEWRTTDGTERGSSGEEERAYHYRGMPAAVGLQVCHS